MKRETLQHWMGWLAFTAVGAVWGAEAPVALPLDEAVRTGQVTLRIEALGGATGDTLALRLRRRGTEPLRLRLLPGTVFTSEDPAVQNQVAGRLQGEAAGESLYYPCREIVLSDDRERVYYVEAYCLDFHRDNPQVGGGFRLGSVDARVAAIVAAGTASTNGLSVIQAAIWIDREGLATSQLQERFGVTDDEAARARALLERLGPTGRPPTAPRGLLRSAPVEAK